MSVLSRGVAALVFLLLSTSPKQEAWSTQGAKKTLNLSIGFSVKAKPFVQPFNITPVGTVGDVWTFGAVFNESVLNETFHVQNHLSTMNVPFNDGSGNVVNITLKDICFSPLAPDNDNCTIVSVMNYFQNNVSWLDTKINFFYTYPYHIHYCTRFPFSKNDSRYFFNIPCLGEYGGAIDPKIALAGYKKSKSGEGYDYDTATVLIVTFVVHDNENKKVMAWEKAMLDYLRDYKEHAKFIDIDYSAF